MTPAAETRARMAEANTEAARLRAEVSRTGAVVADAERVFRVSCEALDAYVEGPWTAAYVAMVAANRRERLDA